MDTARAHVIGTYKLWRYSVEHEDEFLLGKLTCSEDPGTRALKVDVQQRCTDGEGLRCMRNNFWGYMFCIGEIFFTIVRGHAANEVRIAFYPHFRMDQVGTDVNPRSVFAGKQNHVVQLDGFTVGIASRKCFFSPIQLSLVDDAEELVALDETVGIFAEDDTRLPRGVVKNLKRHGPLRRL